MKYLAIIFVVLMFSSCTKLERAHKYRNAIDSLREEVGQMERTYHPGLGEIMSGIQMHHAKLWFAGINNNWKLAEYETSELRELFASTKLLEIERPELKSLPMIYPMVDSIAAAIKNQDFEKFKNGFKGLTATCNICHQMNHFEFNVIIIPIAPPVVNQDFKPH